MDDMYDIETLAEEIKATERKLSDLRQEYRERKTAGLRAAIEARNEADKLIREEMKSLGYQSPSISWRNVGSLAYRQTIPCSTEIRIQEWTRA